MKTKVLIFTILFIFLFYFSLFIAGFFPFVAKYKIDLSLTVISEYTKDIILHPIQNIKGMHENKNPLMYISFGSSLILFIFLLYKSRKKDYENVGDRYGVQGSSRWAKREEIFKVPEQITIVPSKNMYAEIKDTLKNIEVKK